MRDDEQKMEATAAMEQEKQQVIDELFPSAAERVVQTQHAPQHHAQAPQHDMDMMEHSPGVWSSRMHVLLDWVATLRQVSVILLIVFVLGGGVGFFAGAEWCKPRGHKDGSLWSDYVSNEAKAEYERLKLACFAVNDPLLCGLARNHAEEMSIPMNPQAFQANAAEVAPGYKHGVFSGVRMMQEPQGVTGPQPSPQGE